MVQRLANLCKANACEVLFINFVVENDHIVFDVNLGAAAREHIEPTTRLLALARAIDRRRRR